MTVVAAFPLSLVARHADNHWALNGGPFTFPMNIRLTSVRNDTVLDVLQSEYGGQVGSAA